MSPQPLPYADDVLLALLRDMLRIRRFEERAAELYGEGKIRGFLHLYIGEEAVAVGVMHALGAHDAVVSTYREHGHALLKGVPMQAIFAEMYGHQEGCSRGRGDSMHLFDARPVSTAATRSSRVVCRWRSAWPWPTACRERPMSRCVSSVKGRWRRVHFMSQ